jgi:hypothetical protein
LKILAMTRRRPGTTFEKLQALQTAEVTQVWALIKQDFVREIYFDPNKPTVVLILEADNVDAARARLAQLPMVQAGLIEFDFTLLGPYQQLEAIFAG